MKQNISVAIIYTNGVLISSPKWEDWIFSSLKINFNIQLYICKIIKEGDKWRTYIIYKKYIYIHCCCFSVPSHVPLFVTSWTIAHQVLLSLTISLSSPKFMSIELMMPSNHLILCSPFLLLPSVFPSISVFSNEFDLHISWPKHWSFSFSLSNEYSELISFRTDWFDLAVQETLKHLLQHHSSNTSIFWHSAFFMVQLLHPRMTTEKTIELTIWTCLANWGLCFLISYLR